jgi:TonB family protein
MLVRSAESGTSIERMTVTPAGDVCLSPAKYEMANGSLTETVPALLGKTDPCKIPEKELLRERKRCKKCMVFSGANVAMQVQCGNQTRIIRSDILDRDMFDPAAQTPEHTSWTMQLLESLDKSLGPGVMDKPMFELTNAEEVLDKSSDPEILKQLETGKYDELFQGAPDKPSDLYRASQKRQPPPTVKLLNSLPIAPESFQLPGYPPLARVTHTEGAVSVKIEVDANGAVTNIDFESGHPLLHAAVQDAISHWRFPKNEAPQLVEATIQFALNCPPYAEQKSPTN